MLSAFTARPIIELRQRDKSKIETILAYGDRVLVGLNTGSLRIYRLNELPPPSPPPPVANSSKPANGSSPTPPTKSPQLSPSSADFVSPPALPSKPSAQPSAQPSTKPSAQPSAKPTDLLRELEKFSTRAVEQLAIIKESNILVSLSNYHVSLHDLASYEPLPGCAPLTKTKNASCFAVTSNIVRDGDTGIPEIISRLAVAVKRRLLLWRWHESELDEEVSEVVLSESIRSITWASATKLVCGMNGGFVVVDVLTHNVEDVIGPGAIGGGSGQGAGRFGAASMGYIGLGGYVPKPLATKLADGQMLLAKDINTLFVTDDGKPLEKKQIPWQTAPEGIGYSYPYILALHAPAKGQLEVRNPDTLNLLQTISLPGAAQLHFPPPTVSLAHKGFHISSERCVWKMGATDYDTQVEELVEAGKYDEAVSLLNMLEDALLKNKTETLREVKMLKAELLFKNKKYRDSMDLFNEDEVHAPPERVLKLFPRNIAGDYSGVPEDEEEDEGDKSDESGESEREGKANGEKVVKPPQDFSEAAASPSRGAFSRLLYGRSTSDSETASISSSKKLDSDDDASIRPKRLKEKRFDEKGLMKAVLELNSYLAGTRARLQRVLDPVTGKLKPRNVKKGTSVDPFRILFGINRDEADEELETELQNTFKLVDTTLFRAYMFSRPTLAGSLFRIPNFCDPDVVNEKLLEHNRFNELVDFFHGKKLHHQALELLKKFGTAEEPDEKAPTLHGPRRTVAYLQSLPPEMIDLILEFSEWTLRANPELGMEIFVADTENAETLPRDRVVKFLGDIDSALEIQYLNHIIMELNDMTPDFHNQLVELMVNQLKSKTKGEEWDLEMGRLVRFLKESKQYSLIKAFGLIPRDDPAFYEAQAVVLSGMGQHKQALEVYVFKMKDYAKAEDYCNRIHRTQETLGTGISTRVTADKQDADDKLSIYHTLLSLYLAPPGQAAPNLPPALDLLSRHGSRLSATSTMSLIPDDIPVKELESYFRGRIRSANSVVNESRVLTGLRHTLLVDSQALLLLGGGIQGPTSKGGRSRKVVIGEERVCGVCHKRLGGSVVSVLQDNTVVHYGCLSRAGGGGGTGGRPGTSERGSSSWGSRY